MLEQEPRLQHHATKMTDIYKPTNGEGLVSDGEHEVVTAGSRAARRKRMEIRNLKFVSGVSAALENGAGVDLKRRRSFPAREFEYAVDSFLHPEKKEDRIMKPPPPPSTVKLSTCGSETLSALSFDDDDGGKSATKVAHMPRFGVTSVCGRRRDMEDAVAVSPSFIRSNECQNTDNYDEDVHYFAVYDGHGCSHVAMRCRERLHELVREELSTKASTDQWKQVMERSFSRMDKEIASFNKGGEVGDCRCELQMPDCDAVGSTAVVAIVTPRKIIVANCGDSRAVLCRKGKAIALSSDHKPDRPDELNRIQEAGGRVIYWDGPRVLGVLGMSRAIGDNYLKPYVCALPEVTITDRTAEDECLILGSDGLWDVVSNANACSVARMCLHGKLKRKSASGATGPPSAAPPTEVKIVTDCGKGDKACSAASMLLTKLALSRQSNDNVSVVVVDLRGKGMMI